MAQFPVSEPKDEPLTSRSTGRNDAPVSQPRKGKSDTPNGLGNRSSSLNIRLSRSERALFTGRTGSGKSTLADKLIRSLRYRTVVIDPKGAWDFPGYLPVTAYDPNPETRYQVFRPFDGAAEGWADLVTVLNAAWSDPNPVLVYIDELTLVTTPRTAPPIMFRFARQGRQHNKGLWTGTQRPSEVPTSFLTEAEHWFVFDLRAKADREKVAGFLGDAALSRPKGRYSFWYANPELPDAVLFRQPS